MDIGDLVYCDLCGLVIFPNEGTPVHIHHGGRAQLFVFHNRRSGDCLDQELTDLKQRHIEREKHLPA
jgi:hypothetical protein